MKNYNTKKLKNQTVKKYMDKHLSLSGNKRFKECGSFIEFLAGVGMEKMKVHQSNFCKNRFCPICAWKRAKKDAMRISVLMDYIEKEHNKSFILVTLTAPNVKSENLKDEITHYNKSFKKLVERKEITNINQGYMRKLEVTYNSERDDYHPHFHCVFAINKSYFTSRDYVNQSRWLELWRNVMNDNSITQVDVRKVNRNMDSKAVNEMAKYAAKDSDYSINQAVFDSFYKSLKGRQVMTYNGLFADANKKFKAGELDHYLTVDDTKYVYYLLYQWGKKTYIEQEKRELTADEIKLFNKNIIDEIEVD